MHSAGKDELRVILAPDDRVLADLRLLIRTEKYTKRKQTSSLSPIEEQILRAKATHNAQREKELVERIRRAVGRADLVINAADITVASQDAAARIADDAGDDMELLHRASIEKGASGPFFILVQASIRPAARGSA